MGALRHRLIECGTCDAGVTTEMRDAPGVPGGVRILLVCKKCGALLIAVPPEVEYPKRFGAVVKG